MAVGLRTDGVMGSEFSPRRSLEIKETDPIYERQSAPCPPFMGDSGRTQPYGSCWGWGESSTFLSFCTTNKIGTRQDSD